MVNLVKKSFNELQRVLIKGITRKERLMVSLFDRKPLILQGAKVNVINRYLKEMAHLGHPFGVADPFKLVKDHF